MTSFKLAVSLFATLIALSCNACDDIFREEPRLYGGADFLTCKTCFHNDGGAALFKSRSMGANPFFGYKIDETISVEGGYQYIRSSRISLLETGAHPGHGAPIPALATPINFKSTLIIKGPHVGLILNTPKIPDTGVSFFGGVSIAFTKAQFERKTIMLSGIHPGVTTRKFEKTRTLERWIAGINLDTRSDIFARLSVTLINTSHLSAFASDGIATHAPVKILPKNMTCYNIGVGLRF